MRIVSHLQIPQGKSNPQIKFVMRRPGIARLFSCLCRCRSLHPNIRRLLGRPVKGGLSESFLMDVRRKGVTVSSPGGVGSLGVWNAFFRGDALFFCGEVLRERASVRSLLVADPDGWPMKRGERRPNLSSEVRQEVVTWLNDLCEHPPLIIEAMHSKFARPARAFWKWIIRYTREAKPPTFVPAASSCAQPLTELKSLSLLYFYVLMRHI